MDQEYFKVTMIMWVLIVFLLLLRYWKRYILMFILLTVAYVINFTLTSFKIISMQYWNSIPYTKALMYFGNNTTTCYAYCKIYCLLYSIVYKLWCISWFTYDKLRVLWYYCVFFHTKLKLCLISEKYASCMYWFTCNNG